MECICHPSCGRRNEKGTEMKKIPVAFFVLVVGLVIGGAALVAADEGPSQVSFSGEMRLRPEYRSNADFNKDTKDTNAFVGSRIRLTGLVQVEDDISAKMTFQDSRNWGEETSASGLTNSGPQSIDIHEGYVEFKNFLKSPFMLRAGRQELVYGDQRLIGNFNWSNQARAFDAFKIVYACRWVNVDAWTAKRKENDGTTAGNTNLDRDFSGLYSVWKNILPGGTIDLYGLQDREGDTPVGADPKNIFTLGTRVAGKAASLDYAVELPYQFGDNGTIVGVSSSNVKVSAYAFAAKAGYTFEGTRETRIGFEYDYASGDNNPNDSMSKTFNNLYPTNHPFYGYMDYQGWRNTSAWNINASAKPGKSTYLYAGYWDFSLAQAKDGWYSASGSSTGALRSASATNTEKHVGSEVDLLGKYIYDTHVIFEAGYSHFFEGAFIKDRVSSASGSDWTYVMMTVKF